MYVNKNLIQTARFHFNFTQVLNKKIPKNYLVQIPYILLVMVLTLLTTLPKATSHGLGGDGQFYAVVARNLSEGIGSFWMPYFSDTVLSVFYEHPPLGLWIQSLFFRLFSDSYLVEKLYSVGTLLIIELFMVLIWFRIFKSNERNKILFWLPVLFLILIPTVTYSIGNNLLENTMGVFTIISIYFLLRSIDNGINYNMLFLGALMIVLAILTKGPVGAFPLAFYLIYMLTTRSINIRAAIQSTLILLSVFALLFGLLLINDDARNNLTHYYNGQLMNSIKDGRGMAVGSHFYIVWELLKDLLALFIFLAILYLFKFKNIKNKFDSKDIKYAALFILIGISASIPSMISLKQNVTYIVTCYPYFAIGFAILAAAMFDKKINVIRGISLPGKIISILSIIGIFLILVFSFSITDRVMKQENYYYDAKLYSNFISGEKIIGICPNPAFQWDIHSFFARYYRVSLDYVKPYTHKYFIGTSTCAPDSNIKYKVINSQFRYLKLYQLI